MTLTTETKVVSSLSEIDGVNGTNWRVENDDPFECGVWKVIKKYENYTIRQDLGAPAGTRVRRLYPGYLGCLLMQWPGGWVPADWTEQDQQFYNDYLHLRMQRRIHFRNRR